jgi:hypothetical protein
VLTDKHRLRRDNQGETRSHPDCRCAGKTGEEQAVQVRHDEGAAIRIVPEPCAGIREDDGEASAGARTGQPLSRENWILWVPTRSSTRKATRSRALSRASARPGVVADPGMCGSSSNGNREISGSACAGFRRSAMGRRGVIAVDARAREV